MREWLKNSREAKGYTMKEMAQKLDISECYYCAIENGSRQKKMDIALASSLASALGIPIFEIVQHENAWIALANSEAPTQ